MTKDYKELFTGLGFYPTPSEQTNEPSTEADVQAMEQKLGYPLPEDYRQFLLQCPDVLSGETIFTFQNEDRKEEEKGIVFGLYGGDIVETYFGQRHALESDDNYNLDNYPGMHLLRDINTSPHQIGWPEELLPIGITPGNSQICLAFKGLRPRAIFLWIVNPWQDEANIFFVADSFDDFAHMLRKGD